LRSETSSFPPERAVGQATGDEDQADREGRLEQINAVKSTEVVMSDFGRLLEREIPRLRRYARALIRDSLQADDLVQDCLLRALAKQHLWQPGSDMRAWLFTLLHNVHIDHLRRLARERAHAEAIIAPEPVTAPTANTRLELRELDRAIAQLPETQRQALLLIGLEGITYEKAASVLGLPVGTVRSRTSRARAALRCRLLRSSDERRDVSSATRATTNLYLNHAGIASREERPLR
jgi:RNA polymerase sigma-70 factor, ECF subfamily